MKNDRLCPYCLAGTMRVLWGRRIGESSHKQRRECKRCGRRETVVIERDKIFPRKSRVKAQR